MTDNIKVISPTSRQEGHAELRMEVDDEGIVTKGRYFSITPVRGLEKMVLNKKPETPPVLCQRICGVCPIPHTLASATAVDSALGIEIPKAAELLRRATLAAHNINSAAIHHFLVAPDITDDSNFVTAVKSVSNIRKTVQYVVDMIAGEGIHPSDIRPGGMARNISPLALDKLQTRIKALKPDLEAHVELIKNLVLEAGLPKDLGANLGDSVPYSPYASYGGNEFPYDDFTEILPEAWYDDEEVGKRACTQIPLIGGKCQEVGPRANMAVHHGFKDKGVIAQHVARADEMLVNYNDLIEALDAIDTSANTMADWDEKGTGKLGFGVISAPRGYNVHMAKIVDGRVAYYNALVPTTWNIPIMGPATEGFHYDLAPHVIRAYDPCLSCATHVMVVDDEDNSVIKNEMVRI